MLKDLQKIWRSRVASSGNPARSLAFVVLLMPQLATAEPPGQVISNQAQVDYLNLAGQPVVEASNVVDVVTAVVRSPAGVEFTRVVGIGQGAYQEPVGPSACFQGGAFVTLADPVLLGGGVINPALVQEVGSASVYNIGESVFIRLTDTDQNVDYVVVDTADVTVTHPDSADVELVRLTETGVDTGIFVGYVPSGGGAAVAGDCTLQGGQDSALQVDYADPADPTDTAQAFAVFDPVSSVFESATGAAIDGATIEIVDAVSGLPATVYGNDGTSIFPSSIVSGSSVVDSSGTSYVFGAGEYRFPVVPDGDYQLLVSAPGGYSAPSGATIPDLQLLPGAPYSLGPASFGQTFSHSGSTWADFDIPVDPISSTLFMQKSSLTTIASPGDFVRYELTIENTASSGIATNVSIVDVLPVNVRFTPGTVTRDGVTDSDPVISPDLTMLEFTIGDLAPLERVVISYVVEIISGGAGDEIVNTATASADAGLVSNAAEARIRLTEDLFRSTSTLIGRVVEGHCSQATFAEDDGVAGIRIYLEDGRFAVSDEGGRFHFEGLQPGGHVAQIDPESVPAYFEVVGCDTAPQFAGRADSQFVRLHRGSLNRADFYLRRKLAPEGQVDIELQSTATSRLPSSSWDR